VPNWGDEGKRDTNDSRSVLVSGICERSVQIDYDDAVTTAAIQHLYNYARADGDRPLFLQVSYTHPHEPYLCQKPFWDLYDNVEIPPLSVPALSSEQHDAHSIRLLRDFNMLDVRFGDEEVSRARRAYYGSISYIDDMIGRIIDTLKAIGHFENTAIVFTSDHGETLGERGMWFKKHFFEPTLRVPLIISAPSLDASRVSTPVSLVDLLPTFMGLATGSTWQDSPETLEGEDLTSLVGIDANLERTVYAEYLAESTTSPIFMIRRGPYKLISSADDPPLLFNLIDDPCERTNLAVQPEHGPVLKELESLVKEKWNSAELTKDIVRSQKRRRLILTANAQGQSPRWNHNEQPGEDVLWYRGEGSYNDWAFAYLPVIEEV